MLAEETTAGLLALGVLHQTTLPYSPYQYVAPKFMWPTGAHAMVWAPFVVARAT
jgi:hypothetical protein